MRHGLVKIFTYLFVIMNYPALSQQQLFKTYTINDGLVANSIRRVFQDNKGFLWIATWEGLSKYDGYKFRNYSRYNGLSHDLVNDIYETADHKLYIACNDGSIDIIDENEMPRPFLHNMVINRFRTLDKQQSFIPTDHNGLWQLKNDKFLKPSQSFPQSIYFDVAKLNDSLLIAASPDSFHVLNLNLGWFPLKLPAGLNAECLLTDSKKRVWIGTYSGLKLLSPIQEKNSALTFLELPAPFNIPQLKKAWIRDIFEDADSNLWFATYQGLIKVENDGSVQHFNAKNGFPSDLITCIFQDREKNMWVGTMVGLVKLVTRAAIKIYDTDTGLAASNVTYLLPFGKSNLLVATPERLQVYDPKFKQFTLSIPQPSPVFGRVENTKAVLLTQPTKFFEFDTTNLNFGKPVSFIAPQGIGCSVQDKFGNIFSGSYGGMYLQPQKSLQGGDFFNFRLNNLLIDRNGYLWIGSFDHGLYRVRYSDVNEKIIITEQLTVLPGEQIRSLFEDRNGGIWVGTRYHGVYQLKADQKQVKTVNHFHQGTGLSSNWIQHIAEDATGCIWLGFYLGLDKLIPHERTYSVFNFSAINNYFTKITNLAIDRNNALWLATPQGFVNIQDGHLEDHPAAPVYITSVLLADSLIRMNQISEKLRLSYKQNQLKFEFTSPGFINEKKILYSYRLAGDNNTSWSLATNDHTVSYASLQPGEYQFEVRTLSWNGVWGKPASFEFTIKPPFWQYNWFIACAAALTAGIIYWIVKRRINGIRKESDLKQKIAESEMMALKAQMNPHFIFNCLSAIDNLIQTDQKDKATVYLNRFAKLIRLVLDSSKNNLVPFYKDYQSLQLFLELEAFRYNNKFEFNLQAEEEVLNSDIKVPPLIIQPFVENSIHHGLMNRIEPGRKLDIQIGLEKDYLKYTIADNGVGRQMAGKLQETYKPEHISYGMEIASKRVHLHNNNRNHPGVKITDLKNGDIPEGTKVEIWLAIK